jgi:two-component system response regulator AtoC
MKILIIDDEKSICQSLSFALEDEYEVKTALNPIEGLNIMKQEEIDLCLLDLRIGEHNGIDVLKNIKKLNKSTIVIIMTAFGSIETSIEAIRNGAYDYLTKPINIDELNISINKALEYRKLNEKVEYLSSALKEKYIYNGIVGKSPLMKKVYELIEKVKDIDTNILITGESGTGKEMVARAIHYAGKRKKERFEVVNCAAIPENLFEEELFGHKKGSFTGAVDNKKGKLEYANKGTILLDEIGDMPLSLQAKLLRVIQEKEYTPIGSNERVKVDIRFIAATNKDIKKLVEEEKFREDLYFRLNVIEIKLPSLRNKKQDLPILFKYFIDLYNDEMNKNTIGFAKDAERKLLDYNYPGNIRELSNIIEHAMAISTGALIKLEDLPNFINDKDILISSKNGLYIENINNMKLQDVEKIFIEKILKENEGHRQATADKLGISEKGLRNKIKKYNL